MPQTAARPFSAETLRTSFDRATATYREHAGVQRALADWLAEWLPQERKGRAIELGAGPGTFTRRLVPWKGSLLATDISPAMCAAGRASLPEAEWRVLAAENPGAGPWDWVFSSGMLQWAADPAKVFSAWRAALVPGGRILGSLFAAESLPEWGALAGDTFPLVWRKPETWRAWLADAGLTVRREQAERRQARYVSALAFLRSLHGVGAAPVRRLPPARLLRLLRDYQARHAAAEGVAATWTFYRFEASAEP